MSIARRHVMLLRSIPSSLPWWMCASIIAASRLFAAPIACMSPVKWRLRSSIGTICVQPPPAAPPFTPNTGPSDGSRSAASDFLPIAPRPCVSPTSVVVLPSPAAVGVMPATQMSLPSGRSDRRSSADSEIFALYRP